MSDNLIDLTQVYKLVFRPYPDCQPRSAFMKKGFSLTYEVGKFTYPSIGYIMAFDTLENASSVIRGIEHEVWVASAQIAPFYTDWLPFPNESPDCIELFWANPNPYQYRNYDLLDVPRGTVFCESLRLDRRVR